MYNAFAKDYDHFVNWNSRLAVELPFIENHLETLRDPSESKIKVLDAACGTGMHAISLVRHGYCLSAADLSAPMIKKARLNASAAGTGINFAVAGFGKLTKTFGKGQFDAVLCLGNSLPHLLTPADLHEALADFAGCLRPGGMLLIQNRNFDLVLAGLDRWMEPQAFSDATTEWLFYRFYDFEPDGLIRFNIVTLKRSLGEEWNSSVESTRLFPQMHKDLEKKLAEAGFSSIKTFGSMAGELFSPLSSGNLILVALKE